MIQRQAIRRLHHAEHDLARDEAFLRHAEFAHVLVLLGHPLGPDRGHVVEHHREILIDHRTQQAGQHLVDFLLVLDHRVHRPQ